LYKYKYVTIIIIITQNVQKYQQYLQYLQYQQYQKHQTFSNSSIINMSNKNTNSNINKNINNNNNINDMNNNESITRGILASSKNPATLRRLSQTGDENTNNEVSWHKRVVVHRVPRSDASRSMFHSKGKESNNSNQCCIVL